MTNYRFNLDGNRMLKPVTIVAVCIFVASLLAFVGSVSFQLINGHKTDNRIAHLAKANRALALGLKETLLQNRRDLCHSIDADHNRERARLIQGEIILYNVPAFRVLVANPQAELIAYNDAKKNYNDVRRTRPGFCSSIRNPVRPFPSLADFRAGRVKAPKPISRPLGARGSLTTPVPMIPARKPPRRSHGRPVRVRPVPPLPLAGEQPTPQAPAAPASPPMNSPSLPSVCSTLGVHLPSVC